VKTIKMVHCACTDRTNWSWHGWSLAYVWNWAKLIPRNKWWFHYGWQNIMLNCWWYVVLIRLW